MEEEEKLTKSTKIPLVLYVAAVFVLMCILVFVIRNYYDNVRVVEKQKIRVGCLLTEVNNLKVELRYTKKKLAQLKDEVAKKDSSIKEFEEVRLYTYYDSGQLRLSISKAMGWVLNAQGEWEKQYDFLGSICVDELKAWLDSMKGTSSNITWFSSGTGTLLSVPDSLVLRYIAPSEPPRWVPVPGSNADGNR